ncbi:MAG TPA: PAS domain S-box protein [Magnetospirillum sp.]|nr:PAS domain S-box protein [Magnetospirillum sp.]
MADGTFWRSRIGRRLLTSLFLFSLTVTIGLFAFEIVQEYRHGLKAINGRLDEIEHSYAVSAADGIWAMDREAVKLLAQGVVSLPGIRYVEIRESDASRPDALVVWAGERQTADFMPRDIALVHHDGQQSHAVGELHVEATRKELYEHLLRRGQFLLGQKTLNTLLIATFFLFVFHHMVTRRILDLSSRVAAFGGVPLDGASGGGTGDEVDRLDDTFELMRANIAAKGAELEARESQYRTLVEHSPDTIVRYGRDCRRVYGGRGAAEGCDPDATEMFERKLKGVFASGEPAIFDLEWRAGTWLEMRLVPEFGKDGAVENVLAISRDVSDSKLVTKTLHFIADPAGTVCDGDFMAALARHLGETLGVAYVIIDRLDREPGIAETVALCAWGEILPNMRYALAGTPCADVAGSQFCLYPSGVQERFPEDKLLVDMGVHSYAGAPLKDTTGKPIGLIAILHTAPFANESMVTQILRIVTPRAAAELERAESDRTLAQREQQFRSLAESAPDNIIGYDLDGSIRYMNARLLRSLSLASVDEVIGKRPSEVWPDGRFSALEQGARQACETGETVTVELKPGDELHHVVIVPERDTTGSIIGTLAFGRNVTELVRMQRERQLLQQAVDQSADTFFVVLASGRFAVVNDSACRSLGYSHEEFRTMTVADIDADLSLAEIQQKIMSLEPGKPSLFESRHRAKDGRIIPIELTVSLFEDCDERSCIAIARDITERKRFEAELESKERQYRSLAENSPDVIVRYDRDLRRIYVNPRFEDLTGRGRSDVMDKVPGERWGGSIPSEKYLAIVRGVIESGQPARFRMARLRPCGNHIVHDVICVPERGEDGESIGALTIGRDVTKQEATERQFQTLVENSPDHIVRLDRDTRLLFANQNTLSDYGWSAEEVFGKTADELAEQLPLWAKVAVAARQAIAQGVPNVIELMPDSDVPFNQREVRHIPEFDGDGNVVSVLGICRDISERKAREAHQIRLNRLLQAIWKAPPHLDEAFDEHELFPLVCATFVEQGGYDAASIRLVEQGEAVSVHAARSDGAGGSCVVPSEACDADGSAVGFGLKDAQSRIFGCLAVHSADRDGFSLDEIALLAEFTGNLAANVLAQRERKRRSEVESQLIQAQKFEALGLLAGNIAHDFNNLLGAILGYADLIAKETRDGDSPHLLASRIAAAGQHGKALIAQILTFARRTNASFERFSLAASLEEIRTLLAGTIPSTTRLLVSADGAHGTVVGDRNQVVQMVINLCINAHHALEGRHGELAVSAHPARFEGEAVRRLCRRDNKLVANALETWHDADGTAHAVLGRLCSDRRYTVVRIADTGCGMDEPLLQQVFAPFFTTKGRTRGTGLGLSMVHGAVVAHDGALVVESRLGQGTCFQVFLPVGGDEPAAAEAPKAAGQPSPPLAAGGRVLVVDDDPRFCDMLSAVLERRGFEVAPCSDPREALEAIDEFGCAWDALVTDQTMPHMTGLELVRAVRERYPDLPCILCTGFVEEGMNDDTLRQAGVTALLRKPFDLDGLVAILSKEMAARPR